jgi:hypothetical protein
MILGMEIGMLVVGLIALCTGKLTLSKKRVVTGGWARGIGVVLLMPLPLAFLAGVAIGFLRATGGLTMPEGEFRILLTTAEAAIAFSCAGLAFALAASRPAGTAPSDGPNHPVADPTEVLMAGRVIGGGGRERGGDGQTVFDETGLPIAVPVEGGSTPSCAMPPAG